VPTIGLHLWPTLRLCLPVSLRLSPSANLPASPFRWPPTCVDCQPSGSAHEHNLRLSSIAVPSGIAFRLILDLRLRPTLRLPCDPIFDFRRRPDLPALPLNPTTDSLLAAFTACSPAGMLGLSVARSFPRLLVLCSPRRDLHAALQSSARATSPAPRNRKLDRNFRFPSETASVTGPPWRGQSSCPRSSLPRPRLARPGPPYSPSPERFRLG
jgi:hypothetical protein